MKIKSVLYFISILLVLFVNSHNAYAIEPDRTYVRMPQEDGLIYKRLNVITEDDYRIETWFYPTQDFPKENAGQKEMLPYKVIDNAKRPTIIICSGDAGNMSYQQIGFAMMYSANGYNVVTFDWRGFGNSSEFEMDSNYLCYTEMLTDYEAVIEEVIKQPEVDKQNIYLFGWSTGAYLSMITAYNNKSVKSLFVIGMPSSFEDVIPQIIKVHPKHKTAANLLVPEDFPKEQMPIYIAPHFKNPILLIVGSEDDRAPQWMAKEIFEALHDNSLNKLSIFNGAGHGGMQSPHIVDSERFYTETIEFIDSCENKIK